ncbi:MAG: MlaD family protein [Treponema sp.]|jgi:phospholipid/cholesterol/gamma-HCH transport system substrate-binding protein|nr:MlaD family protein [Treponema sp.]
MRFRIRFADQIVGVLTVFALLVLVAVIFMLGSRQRWFARDYRYIAYFESAAGLSLNMTVQYKGFTIGNIKSIRLTGDDRVEATIAIYDSYADRVREGSLVELLVSPIGLGNQFLFYAGLGKRILDEGEAIPTSNSPEGRALLNRGLAYIPSHDDSITLLITRANTVLDSVNHTIVQVNEALAGNDATALGRILGNVETTISDVSILVEGIDGSVQEILASLKPVIGNLETLSTTLAAPDNSISALMDPQGEVYTNLVKTIQELSGAMGNLEKTSALLPGQFPQIALILAQVREALRTAEGVLTALANNPLLKNGVPSQPRSQSSGASFRDAPF